MIRRFIIYVFQTFAVVHLKLSAKHFGACEYEIMGLKVICKYKTKNLIEEALEKIRNFDDSMLEDFVATVDLVIFSGGVPESDALLGKSTIIISEKEKGHISTSTHLAGWFLYYYELINEVKKVGVLGFSREKSDGKGKTLRKEFLGKVTSIK